MQTIKYFHGQNLLLPLFKYSRFQCMTELKKEGKMRVTKILQVSFLSPLVEHFSTLFFP